MPTIWVRILWTVDMLMSLEDEFDVEIPDEEIEKMRTVGEVVSYIEEHM